MPVYYPNYLVSFYGGGYHMIPYDDYYFTSPYTSYAGDFATPMGNLPYGAVLIGQFLVNEGVNEVIVPEGYYNKICFELVAGAVSFNTIWLRPERTQVTIARRLNPGEILTIDLGVNARYINALSISDNGRGVYRIYGL